MRYQYTPYIWLLISSALITMILGLYAYLRCRKSKGSVSFILSMVVLTIWSLGNAFEMSAVNFATKLFWANIQYFAYCFSPVTLIILCMQFTGYEKWVRSKKILLLAVLPSIILILVWTDGLHGMMRYDMKMDFSGEFPVITKKYGSAFYIHGFYSHSLNITAWILLIRAAFFKVTVYRKQAFALLFGLSLIIIPNILYVIGLSPVKRFDITPVFFGPAGIITAWGIFRYKLFDLVPIARATVIENMDAGVLVLDLQNRIIDINPAFQSIIGQSASQVSTKRVEEVFCNIKELLRACMNRDVTYTELSVKTVDGTKDYEFFLSPLTNTANNLIGRLIVAYDITEKKKVQQAFIRQQRRLAVNEERERLVRDLHDNLGQILGFINLQSQGIRQELKNAGVDNVSLKLDKLVKVTQDAHNEIREYIKNARYTASTQKDFLSALDNDIKSFEEQTETRVNLSFPIGFSGEELETDARLNILNIIKEALNNVQKHSAAHYVTITILIDDNTFTCCIEDNGKGFDIIKNNISINSSFGLKIMQERADAIGARLDIKSDTGGGTRVYISLPIERSNK